MATITPLTGYQRYLSLIVSIALFLSLITALLIFTFYTSNILQKNTVLIHSSQQVSNDAQSVIKDLFDMQNSYGEDIASPHIITVLKRLEENSKRIDKNLLAMQSGETVIDEHGHQVTLPKITDPKTLNALQETQNHWLQLKPKVEAYLKVAQDVHKDSSTPLLIAGEQAKTSSLAMNGALEALTTEVFYVAESQARIIRIVQIVGVLVILAYFAIFIFFFVRRLRKADEKALLAQRETQEIMANVNTGLFLLDKEMNVGNQYSAQLEKIIGDTKIAGENLSTLLRHKVSDKDLETTQSFVKQLYNPRVKEKLVDDLNPLKKVMLHDDKGSNQNRYLDFKFSRVYNVQNDTTEIQKILVNVQDVTQQVRLEQRLEHERAQNDLQIEMLTTILNVSPSIIGSFIRNTKENINKINDVLKSPGSKQHELEEKLTRMYRIMHSLKGEASALNLHSFILIANNFEEKLKGLQSKDRLLGNDFLPLTIHLDELLNLSNTIDALGKRINQSSPNVNQTTPEVATKTATPSIEITDPKPIVESAVVEPLDHLTSVNTIDTPIVEAVSEVATEETTAEVSTTAIDTTNDPVHVAETQDTEIQTTTSSEEVTDVVNDQDETVDTVHDTSSETVATVETPVTNEEPQSVNLITDTPTISGMNEFYQQFADNIAMRQNKQVNLEATGFNHTVLPNQSEQAVKEIAIQLIRNAVVHGIELPDQRVNKGKSATGQVKLSLLDEDKSYKLTIEDDGQGINYTAIKQKAIQMGFAEQDVAAWNKQKLTSLLFKSGFSTKQESDEDAGRGVGMDIIKERIQELQGHLGLDTKEGEFTRFIIKIPK